MKIIWTKHAKERQKQWQNKLGITRDEVENILKNPEQIGSGDMEIKIAQTKRGNGLLRVAFKEIDGLRKIITLYWSSKIEKYWKE